MGAAAGGRAAGVVAYRGEGGGSGRRRAAAGRSVGVLAAQVEGEPALRFVASEAGAEQAEELAQGRLAGHSASREQAGVAQAAAGGVDAELDLAVGALADRGEQHAAGVASRRVASSSSSDGPVPLP